MKTVVSLPDDLFYLAEAAARKMQMSGSQFYATALMEFLDRRHAAKITERLNAVYGRNCARLDTALHKAQIRSLAKEDW